MITITDKGAEKVHEFLASQQADVSVAGLRVGVRGGGCSGFQYQLAFDGLSRIEQHRLVYGVFGAEIGGAIHALALKTQIPSKIQTH